MKEKKEEELKQYEHIFVLIEKDLKLNKNDEYRDEELNIEKISDELKINLLINAIKNDFPKKEEKIINE